MSEEQSTPPPGIAAVPDGFIQNPMVFAAMPQSAQTPIGVPLMNGFPMQNPPMMMPLLDFKHFPNLQHPMANALAQFAPAGGAIHPMAGQLPVGQVPMMACVVLPMYQTADGQWLPVPPSGLLRTQPEEKREESDSLHNVSTQSASSAALRADEPSFLGSSIKLEMADDESESVDIPPSIAPSPLSAELLKGKENDGEDVSMLNLLDEETSQSMTYDESRGRSEESRVSQPPDIKQESLEERDLSQSAERQRRLRSRPVLIPEISSSSSLRDPRTLLAIPPKSLPDSLVSLGVHPEDKKSTLAAIENMETPKKLQMLLDGLALPVKIDPEQPFQRHQEKAEVGGGDAAAAAKGGEGEYEDAAAEAKKKLPDSTTLIAACLATKSREEKKSIKRERIGSSSETTKSMEKTDDCKQGADAVSPAVEKPNAPHVPPRFPKKRQMETELEEEKEESKKKVKRSSSPIRVSRRGGAAKDAVKAHSSTRMKVEKKNKKKEEEKGGKEMEKRRVSLDSVLVKNVPVAMDKERVRRYFLKFGACTLTKRVYNEPPTTVRIVFESRRARYDAFAEKDEPVIISKVKMSMHEDFMEESESGREETRVNGRDSSSSAPIHHYKSFEEDRRPSHHGRRLSTRGSPERGRRTDHPIQLERYLKTCGKRPDVLLTMGPVPIDCPISAIIHYFDGLNCELFEVPYPNPSHPHEFLILRFEFLETAHRILAEGEHRIDGKFLVPVSPPCDVHLRMNKHGSLFDTAAIHRLQQEVGGFVVSVPFMKLTHDMNFACGFATFARPIDAFNATDNRFYYFANFKLEVIQSKLNTAYEPFAHIWEAHIPEVHEPKREEEEEEERIRARRRNRRRGYECASDGEEERREKKQDIFMPTPIHRKRGRPEDVFTKLIVRSHDSAHFLPSKYALVAHFDRFGPVFCHFTDRDEAVVEFASHDEMRAALERRSVAVAGVWIDVLPYRH